MADAWPEVGVREAGPLDVPVIALLHAECFADGIGGAAWNRAAIARVMSLPGSYGYLAMPAAEPGPRHAGVAPAGFLLARAAAGESEILSLGVAASWRRRGAARALLQAALRRAGEAGAARALLEVAEDNLAARALYAAEGFRVVSRRPAYYRRPGGAPAAALVFARRLPR
jgi:ribosomal-protein-alanine N-acetyltransferase